jgi:hypothetical protein
MSTSNGRHDFIWTSFWAFKYLMETLSSLLSYGSRLISISSPRQPQSSIYYRYLFCPRCCVSWFWPDRALGFWDDSHHVLVIPYLLIYLHSCQKQIRFCFDVSLAFATSLYSRVSNETTRLLDSEPQISEFVCTRFISLIRSVCYFLIHLFFDLLASLRLFLARQEQQQIWVGVTVAKAQQPCWSL